MDHGVVGDMRHALALVLLLAEPAMAAPPAPDSEDAAAVRGHEAWVMQQHSRSGSLCCSLADGRVVSDTELRQRGRRWEVLFSKRHWGPAATDAWVPIPVEAILSVASPFDAPTVWIYFGQVRCAVLGPQG